MTLQRWESFRELRRRDRAMDEMWNRLFLHPRPFEGKKPQSLAYR